MDFRPCVSHRGTRNSSSRNRRLDSTIGRMDRDGSLQRLRQALQSHREALEELESALLEFEESISGEAQERPQERQGLDLLSIPELCQELGMGKSWVYRRLRSGEIPSVKLGRSIKVKRGPGRIPGKPPLPAIGRITDPGSFTIGARKTCLSSRARYS